MTAAARLLTAMHGLACAMLLALSPGWAETAHQLAPAPERSIPSFQLERLDGSSLDLAELRGETVLVHFFATWCAPCREEFVSLAKLAAARPSLRILAINVAEAPARIRRFIDAEGVALPILLDRDRKVTRAWGVSVLPTSFVLDATHAARLMVEGDLEWIRADVVAALDALTASASSETKHEKSSEGEIK